MVLIYLVGGPPHQDMFDLKPDDPKEIAGPWKPIATNVTGIQICEAFPLLAKVMDKFVVVRSVGGNQADHDAIQVYNGHHPKKPTPAGGWPQFGSTVAKIQGAVDRTVPPYVSLAYTCTHEPCNEPGPSFLGAGAGPFRAMGASRDDMELKGLNINGLGDRKSLLRNFDAIRKQLDSSAAREGIDPAWTTSTC